ncbi:23120_t:CDS:2, partial [Dentiscutata erythropus]
MATNPIPQNISCLETLALNVLKNSSPKKIANDINIPELDPCFLCNQELFLYEIKKPITLLICGHIYHRDCIETSIKKHSICPKPDCKKEVESTVDSMPGSQNINDLMDISPSLFTDPLFAEEQVGTTNQEVIRSYFVFGKKLEDRFEYYKKSNRDRKAKKKLIDEVTEQLPNDLLRNAIEKRLERARKIYYLFSNIGYEKIQLVKFYSALRISKLSWDEIDAIEE